MGVIGRFGPSVLTANAITLLPLILIVLARKSAACQSIETLILEIGAASDEAALDVVTRRVINTLSDTTLSFHVLRGFSWLRRHEFSAGGVALDSARESFKQARDIDDSSAWAHYGYGLALQRGPKVSGTLIATGRAWSRIFGFDDRAKARRAFERAHKVDPTLAGAAVGLGELALQSQDEAELTRARDALARSLASRTTDPPALVTLGRVAAALGDSATAISVADRLTVADAPTGALHSLLWVLAPADDREDDVGEAFYRLVDAADATALDRLQLELRPILTEKEIASLEQGDLEVRRALLRGGWESRATLAGTSVAERIAEHWRRLSEAVRRFPRQLNGPSPDNALTTKRLDSPFDDRGAIYVRHGEPREVIWTWDYDRDAVKVGACTPEPSPAAPSKAPKYAFRGNESWVYDQPDGGRVMYHFARCFDFPDFVLLYHVPCEGRWVNERTGFDIELPNCGPMTAERVRNEARAALVTDSHRPRFDRNLPVIFDLLAFRGTEGRTDLVAPIAVAADSLTPRETGGETIYGFDLTMAVVDTATGAIARLDTMILGRSVGRLSPAEMVRTHVQVDASPTEDAQFRLTLRGSFNEAEGSFYGSQMRVPDYGGDSLQISSIVLAMPDLTGSWRRGSHSLTLMPLGQFEGGEFRVFYEAYNLEPDRAYVTEITVEPTGRRGPQPLRLRFEDFARPEPDGVVRDVRRVETGLPPGRYRITVQVTDPQLLRSARAEREFVVTEGQAARDGGR